MPVRSSMQYIIDEVRALTGDPSSGGQFTDQQIQDKLDLNRKDIYDGVLKAADQLMPNGTYEWHDFFSEYPFWETDVVIQEPDGAVLTPNTSTPAIGLWQFTADQDFDELNIRGRVYDVYGVASKLLYQIQNELRGDFNFTADGLNVQRISQSKDIGDLAAKYASMGWSSMRQIKLVRRDLRG